MMSIDRNLWSNLLVMISGLCLGHDFNGFSMAVVSFAVMATSLSICPGAISTCHDTETDKTQEKRKSQCKTSKSQTGGDQSSACDHVNVSLFLLIVMRTVVVRGDGHLHDVDTWGR